MSVKTNGLPGSAVSMLLDRRQGSHCLYVGDNSNMTIYVLKRDTLEELGRLGRSRREAGRVPTGCQVSLDSAATSHRRSRRRKRIQKFIRYGDPGCSGTGRTTVGGVLPRGLLGSCSGAGRRRPPVNQAAPRGSGYLPVTARDSESALSRLFLCFLHLRAQTSHRRGRAPHAGYANRGFDYRSASWRCPSRCPAP